MDKERTIKETEGEYKKNVFRNLYETKWKAEGKTQEDFVYAVRAIDPQNGISKSYVSKYLNGKYTPSPQNIKIFCQIFGVEMDEFIPSTYIDKYRYDRIYQDDLQGWLEDISTDCFGLNLSFWYGIRQIMGKDFDKLFPMFAPLYPVLLPFPVTTDEGENPISFYGRRSEPFVESATGTKGKSLFQVERNGKNYNLSPCDLKYLQALQKRIIKAIKKDFIDHRAELDMAKVKASAECQVVHEDGSVDICELSEETLQQIDKWGIYTEEEAQKYSYPQFGDWKKNRDNTETEGK